MDSVRQLARGRSAVVLRAVLSDEAKIDIPELADELPPAWCVHAILEFMQCPLQAPTAATDPKSVKVNLTSGTGLDIEWKDGHVSHYGFVYLRDACPCAMCEDERAKSGRRPGDPVKSAAGALPMFKAAAKPVSAEGVGKYAIKFSWNDGHDLGIYSWQYLREICRCEECRAT